VLVLPNGELVGTLPPVHVETPWWPDVEPVVRAVRERYGIEIVVLRMLEVRSTSSRGGDVTYLAEVARRVPAEPWVGTLDEHPLRQTFARPGRPTVDLAWAYDVLAERRLSPTTPPVQIKTWNLSSLWRIPFDGGSAWLKVVPPFMAHEGPLLAYLAGQRVPILLGQAHCRSLLAEITGHDQYASNASVVCEMVSLLVGLQLHRASRVGELLTIGVPDQRSAVLTPAIAGAVRRTASELPSKDNQTLGVFVQTLSERWAEIEACGIPDTLVHGDFWPGNLRGDAGRLTLLDWGDSCVGNPLLDESAFLERIRPDAVDAIRQYWVEQWQLAVPTSDPAHAFELIRPISSARRAVVYQNFLDRIEPSEQPYHRSDPAEMLRRTAALVQRVSAAKGGRVPSICQVCGTHFEVRPSWLRAGYGVLCSAACREKWTQQRGRGRDGRPWQEVAEGLRRLGGRRLPRRLSGVSMACSTARPGRSTPSPRSWASA
jgi:hypothetical protein